MSSNNLTSYLQSVRHALGNHPETEDIIQELHAHIWDFANNLSRKSGASVDEAFNLAIECMEDPQTLAASFKSDMNNSSWNEPKSVLPEKKITDQEFIILAVIGFFAATIILSIISWVEQQTTTDLSFLNFLLGLIQFTILIILILGYFYYKNEQEFKSQMKKLRHTFEKMEKGEEDDEISIEIKNKLRAIKVHTSGIFQIFWGIFGLFMILYISFIAEWQLFNSNWFNIAIFLALITVILEIILGTIKVFVGEIRMSRMLYSIVQFYNFIAAIFYLLFYPYNLAGFFLTVNHPTGRAIVSFIQGLTSRPDYYFKILIGIAAISELMDAFYNLGKFGHWKPSEHKSLTIKSTEVSS